MATNSFINSSNVSSLVSNPETVKTATTSKVKAFGDQVKSQGKEKVISTVKNDPKIKLKLEINEIILKKEKLKVDHSVKLNTLKLNYDTQVEFQSQNNASNETLEDLRIEYEKDVLIENTNYELSIQILEEEQKTKETELDKLKKDPEKKAKSKLDKKKKELQEKFKLSKEERNAAIKAKKQAVFKAIKKTIVPILVLILTDQLIKAVSETKRLQKLVNKTNDIIRAANTPDKINQARIARDSAVKEIQRVEVRIKNISDSLKKIQTYISIFGIVITIISVIPIPTSVPPGIGIPVNVITKLSAVLEKANKIVLGLSAVLAIVNPIISNIINNITRIKAQLLPINSLIDTKTAVFFPPTDFNELLNQIGETEGDIPNYKGFKFEIKNEQNPKFVVKGNSRRYAVALDTSGVEVLKSEASFTLDPQTLVDQLKLIIDERNLEA